MQCLISSNPMLLLFAHLDHNCSELIWISITCSDWYDIISLHIPSSKTSITSWFFTSIGSQPCWPRCLGKSRGILKSNENCDLRIKRFNCFIPLIFFRALEHVQEKMLQFEVDESMIHANIHASIWQLFLVFYCVHETLELVLVQSCKHLSRNETKNSFWSGGNLPRQNCGESMDFERKSSQMRGEGLGGICVVCAYGPWAQSVTSMWCSSGRGCAYWAVGTECVGCSGEMRFAWHHILRTWRVSGIFWVCQSLAWHNEFIHSVAGAVFRSHVLRILGRSSSWWDACVGAIASRICIGLLCCFVFGVVVVFCCCMVTNLSQKRHNVIGKRCSTSRAVVSCSTNSSSKKLLHLGWVLTGFFVDQICTTLWESDVLEVSHLGFAFILEGIAGRFFGLTSLLT